MSRKSVLILISTLLFIGAGCAGQPSASTAPAAPEPSRVSAAAANAQDPADEASNDDEHAVSGDHLAVLAGSRIALDGRNSFKPGRVEFRFKLYGLDGHDFGPADLKTVHEKKMHLLMVRDDMTGYQHLHPEYRDGKWTVATEVPEAGDHQLYVDVVPIEERPVVLRVPVTIGGRTAKKAFPVPNDDRSAEADGYRVTLAAVDLRTVAEVPLAFTVTKNGRPAGSIAKYLGEYGHVVLIRHNDPDDLYHVHPLTKEAPADGVVRFEATFPVKGRYTLYAQFDVDGEVRTFPITIDVAKAGGDGGM